MIYVIIYLVAIIAANLSVVYFGAEISIINAFLFIGLDITTRDKLHDTWKNDNLFVKMVALIFSGSILSYVLNKDAGQIAIASFVSFAASGAVDAVIYHRLIKHKKFIRINISNVFAAAVDSTIFPTLAFGSIMPLIVLGQFVAKTVGGFLWSTILNKG